jgi:hypothetical protein
MSDGRKNVATAKNSGGKLNELVEMFRDPYERKARAFPGLLMVLPILVAVASTWGTKHPIITGVVGLLVSCGTIFALGNLARDLGKEKQEKLFQDWGGMPTTWMLRHRDRTLEGGIKTVYHQLITQKLGLEMPTAQEELADPQAADDAYGTAARMLRDLTRGKEYSLLLKENISYGFRRNMYGARKLGWAISFVGILIGIVLSGASLSRCSWRGSTSGLQRSGEWASRTPSACWRRCGRFPAPQLRARRRRRRRTPSRVER